MPASDPPPMATSHRPEATNRAAAAMACVPAAQAVTMTSDGPRQPSRMEIPAAPALAIIMGTSRGDTRRAPFSTDSQCDWIFGGEPAHRPGQVDLGTQFFVATVALDVDTYGARAGVQELGEGQRVVVVDGAENDVADPVIQDA